MKLKLPSWFSAHKKATRALAVVLVVAIAGGAVTLRQKNKAAADLAVTDEKARTVTLQKGSLSETVNVSGLVQSGSVSSVTTALTGKVLTVPVKVGDSVKKGDVICTLDTGDIEKDITEQNKLLAEANKQLKEDYDKAAKQLSDAQTNKAQTLKVQDALVSTTALSRDAAKTALDGVTQEYNETKSAYELMITAVSSAQNAADSAVAARETAYTTWIAAGGKTTVSDQDSTPSAEYTAYQNAQQAESDALTKLAEAKTLYDYARYEGAFLAAQTTYNTKKAALDTAQSDLDQATATRQKTMNEIDSTIADLIAQVKAADSKVKKGADTKALKELNEKKNDAILRAETDGEVTELKVTVGSVPKDGVATIQSTSKLILAVKIAEYDINRVKVGLPVRITSDALKNPIAGTLTRISPTAETGDNSGFSADIEITDTKGMHIGGKAKAEIIISEKENVYTLPIDAVGTNAAGKDIIKLAQPDGSTKELEVTTGDKNDYYIEVSGNGLSDGLEVLANANWSELAETAAAAQDGMGGF